MEYIKNDILDEGYYSINHKSGLKIFVYPKKDWYVFYYILFPLCFRFCNCLCAEYHSDDCFKDTGSLWPCSKTETILRK